VQLRRETTGRLVTLATQISSGGEGRIYTIAREPDRVAKIYRPEKRTAERSAKLQVMYANPPAGLTLSGHTAIAWPLDLLRDRAGNTIGFLMPRARQVEPLHEFYTPKTRRDRHPGFHYRYLHRTARNLAFATAKLHESGYVIGDVNESNILVSPDSALITLVDTDSFQVRDRASGRLFRCCVGKPEFTPPELQGRSFASVDRTPEHDRFGLAVLIFQLLMEGTHPFDGVFRGKGDPPPTEARISQGHFPYSQRQTAIVPYRPKPFAPSFDLLHPELRRLFVACFETGHRKPQARPDAIAWGRALELAENALIQCSKNSRHYYGNHLASCPWCDRAAKMGGWDSFPSKSLPVRLPVANLKPKRRLVDTRSPVSWSQLSAKAVAILTVGIGLGIGYNIWENDRANERSLVAAQQFRTNGDYEACMVSAIEISSNSRFFDPARETLDRCRLGNARDLAAAGEFERAIAQVGQIPVTSPVFSRSRGFLGGWSRQLLSSARDRYGEGELDRAVLMVNKIPRTSPLYDEAQQQIETWQQEWQTNAERLQAAEVAINAGHWQQARDLAATVTTPYWQQRAAEIVDRAYLSQARQAMRERDWNGAIAAAEQVRGPNWTAQAQRLISQARSNIERERTRSVLPPRLVEPRSSLLATRIENYERLWELLEQQNWLSADVETRRIIGDNWLSINCQELELIDRLWTGISAGQFGFAAQLRLWEKENGTSTSDYEKFRDRVGWERTIASPDLSAPEGYLPRTNLEPPMQVLFLEKLRSCGL